MVLRRWSWLFFSFSFLNLFFLLSLIFFFKHSLLLCFSVSLSFWWYFGTFFCMQALASSGMAQIGLRVMHGLLFFWLVFSCQEKQLHLCRTLKTKKLVTRSVLQKKSALLVNVCNFCFFGLTKACCVLLWFLSCCVSERANLSIVCEFECVNCMRNFFHACGLGRLEFCRH